MLLARGTGGRRARRALLLVVLLVVGAACERGHPRNVLLISIDSLRADRLGAYGNPRETSPTLDRLAREGTRFARAYSPTSWTLPAHATLLTGAAQTTHGVVTPEQAIGEGVASLATILAGHGYDTRGVYSGPFLEARYGFARGFGTYVSCQGFDEENPLALIKSHSAETSACLRDRVVTWTETPGTRAFFWFVHMWDVHYDYIPPARYVRRFDPDYHGPLDGRRIQGKGFPPAASKRDIAHLVARYDGEIRYVDDTIGEMLAAIRARGLLDDTLVVVTADHGDEFREHGGKGHMKTVYAESVHVPLILWGRGVPRGRVIDVPVALADVAPTVLDLLGLDGPPMDGRSLRDLLDAATTDHPPVVSTLYGTRGRQVGRVLTLAIRDGTTSVMRPPRERTWVQFDPMTDPLEQIPMPVRAATVRDRARRIGEAQRLPPRARGAAPTIRLPPATRQRLKALGYLE